MAPDVEADRLAELAHNPQHRPCLELPVTVFATEAASLKQRTRDRAPVCQVAADGLENRSRQRHKLARAPSLALPPDVAPGEVSLLQIQAAEFQSSDTRSPTQKNVTTIA
jgi:hypothetical protein